MLLYCSPCQCMARSTLWAEPALCTPPDLYPLELCRWQLHERVHRYALCAQWCPVMSCHVVSCSWLCFCSSLFRSVPLCAALLRSALCSALLMEVRGGGGAQQNA
eukprot:gene7366-biopygen13575